MLFGPIVNLEMVTGARRARYFILRALYAAILLSIMWLNYTTAVSWSRMRPGGSGDTSGGMTIQEVAAFSNSFFYTFTIVQLLAVLLLTPAMIAGAIAQERERRTIEYMFASSLTNSEIVMSKFLARTIHVASLLLVGMPLLAIAMLLGGVDPQQLMIVFAVTLATLVSLASLSIASSVWAKRSRDAVSRTYLFLLLFLIVPPIVYGLQSIIWDWAAFVPRLAELLVWANPFVVLSQLGLMRFAGSTTISPWESVWPLLVGHLGFSIVALGWSMVTVRWAYRRNVSGGDRQPRRGLPRVRWRPQLGDRPMLWKEMFASTSGLHLGALGRIAVAILLACAVLPACFSFYFILTSGGNANNELVFYAMSVGTTLECAALILIAVRAAGTITAEKERDTWLSLVSTPLSAGEIIWAKIIGSIYAARWFLLPIGLIWFLAIFTAFDYLLILPVLAAVFACIALAMSSLGVWFSSFCRTSIRAMGSVVALVAFLGGGYMLCCIPFFLGGGRHGEFSLVALIPFLLYAPVEFWRNFHDGTELEQRAIQMTVICGIGTVGYLVLGLLLATFSIGRFDERVGRPMRQQQQWPGTAGRGPNPLASGASLPPTAPPSEAPAAMDTGASKPDGTLPPESGPGAAE